MMTDSFVAALVGAITAIVTSITASWVSFHNIRTEYRTRYHSELISKQIQSCEKLWSVLAVTSRSPGENRLIIAHENGATISVEYARKLHDNLVDIFTSSAGLYFSKTLRRSIFDLRDFLSQEILLKVTSEMHLEWSKTRTNDLDGYVQNLRNAIRNEVGVEDLRVAKSNRPK